MAQVRHQDEPDYIQRFQRVLNTTKVVHYVGVPQNIDYREFYQKLAYGAGSYIKLNEDYRTGDKPEDLDEWLDIRFDEQKRTETFRHSDTRQPIHTDGAYTSYHFDVSFFYCLAYAPIGGATTFIDGVQVVDILDKYEKPLLKELEQVEVIFDKGTSQRNVSPIVRYDEKGPLLCWNYYRISEKNSAEVKDLCERFHWFLENKIVGGGLMTPVYLKTGEAVFFHDERVLHGRNAFYGYRHLMKGGINLKPIAENAL